MGLYSIRMRGAEGGPHEEGAVIYQVLNAL